MNLFFYFSVLFLIFYKRLICMSFPKHGSYILLSYIFMLGFNFTRLNLYIKCLLYILTFQRVIVISNLFSSNFGVTLR